MLPLSQFNFNGFTFHGTSVLSLPSSQSEESFCTCVTFSWWESEEQQCIFSTSLNNPVPLVFNSKILQLYLFSVYLFFFLSYLYFQPTCTDSNKLRELHGLSWNSKNHGVTGAVSSSSPHKKKRCLCFLFCIQY